jgi:ribosomal protein S18 acetylase RimI-like enzyme
MISPNASNWIDRGEPPEPTLRRVLASYLELEPSANAERLQEYAGAVRGMAEADATEVNVAGYLRTLESRHLSVEHAARHRRAAAIALWHIAKVAEVRGRAQRLLAEHKPTGSAPSVPLSTWLADRLLRDHLPSADQRFQIEEPSSADIEFLEERLYEFNAAATGIQDGRGLGIFLRDEFKNIVAGAAGHTWGETCELRQVWVAASLRRQGFGRRLIAGAEAEAVRRGCRQLVLTTHSFQGPEFYRKLGFDVVSELPDYPRGYAHVLLRKRLSPSKNSTS